jgi:hypothetical protein
MVGHSARGRSRPFLTKVDKRQVVAAMDAPDLPTSKVARGLYTIQL